MAYLDNTGTAYFWGKVKGLNISTFTNDAGYLTSHQDISGKADKATTLSGYGITDAKIENGVITLGNNTITPMTSLAVSGESGGTAIAFGTTSVFFDYDHFELNSTLKKISIKDIYVKKSGDTMTGDLLFANSETNFRQIKWTVGNNDYGRIGCGATAANAGYLEIATADDANEPIYVRQYSGNYTTVSRTLTLLDASGNTTFPGNVYLGGANGRGIYYKGTKNTYRMIRFIDNTSDVNGNGIAIGGGGQTIIGGGESADVMADNAGTAGLEICYIGNDGDVNIFTNLQNGWANRKTFTFDTAGSLTIPNQLKISGAIFSQNDIWTHRSGFTMNKTSNNSASAYKGAVSGGFVDDSNQWVARIVGENNTSGQIGCLVQSRNMKTDGTVVSNSLGVYVTKAGAQSYAVSNQGNFRSAIGAAASSSSDYKENIEYMKKSEALKLLDIDIYSFDYVEGMGDKDQFGVIAEEVYEQIPFAVNIPDEYDRNDFDPTLGTTQDLITVDYWKFIPHLIRLVQIQEDRIKQLEEAIKK